MKLKSISYTVATAIMLALGMQSCRDFVEVDTYSDRTLTRTSDYQYVMNNSTNFAVTVMLPLISSDDLASYAADVSNTWQYSPEYYNAFTWAANYYGDNQKDGAWLSLYKQIYVCNEVLYGVMGSKDGTTEMKNSVAAEAKVQRAFAYFTLANLYSPVYNPASADTQMGLPLLLTPSLVKNLSRVSLQKIYEAILDDLLTAVAHLPNYPAYNYHPSKLAAYTLLSRTYLAMRNFTESAKYADLALALDPQLNDLQQYKGKKSSFPRTLDDPEIILQKKAAAQTFNAPLNPELVSLYDANDLRFQMFLGMNSYLKGYTYLWPSFHSPNYIELGLKVPEIILNRAEVYAREGNAEKTADMLNKLRVKRFEANKYVALQASDIKDDLLQAVINERRREFVGTDIRWFDQRRLNMDPAYAKTVTREYKGTTYKLEPNSPRYVYPIEASLLVDNPEIGQSPR